MKVKFKVETGYVGANYESEEFELPDDTSEEELQKMATEWMWDSTNIEPYCEIIEE